MGNQLPKHSMMMERLALLVTIVISTLFVNGWGRKVTISGLSSGADFAIQFQVAFSSLISGTAVFAGQPYHCATLRLSENDPLLSFPDPSVPICFNCPENTTLLYDHCKNILAGDINHDPLIAMAKEYESKKLIDSLSNLENKAIFLFRGQFDRTYLPGSVTGEFFTHFGSNVSTDYIDTIPAQHAWPTKDFGPLCGNTGSLENCGVDAYDLVFDYFAKVFEESYHPPVETIDSNALQIFSQKKYMNKDTERFLDDSGYLYLPSNCREKNNNCDIHIIFHGCNVENYYQDAVDHLSLNRWAEANQWIVLWPKLKAQPATDNLWEVTVQQQQGCWDPYGQTGPLYATKKGLLMHMVYTMLEDVMNAEY